MNKNNELLLVKAPRWLSKYTCPGGKVELGETVSQTAIRETKEELNLDITDVSVLSVIDGLNLSESDNNNNYKHVIFIDHIAYCENPDKLVLNEEGEEYKWLPVDEWLNMDEENFAPYIYENILKVKEYIEKKEDNNSPEDKYKRALADYQNLLKRTSQEKIEFIKFANEKILSDLLPVYDNLKISMAHADESSKGWLEGIKYVIKQFKDALNANGIEEIATEGSAFDHNTMEAMSNEETEDAVQDGLVAKEIKAGYKLNGKVIVPAKVAVYKLKTDSKTL